MKFPKYKALGLVSLFNIRISRYDFLDAPRKILITWGGCAAYNSNRIERIGKLPLISPEITPWRHYILHEVSYFTNRVNVYSNRWQKAYERCYLALSKLKRARSMATYSLWKVRAYTEGSRLGINLKRDISSAKANSSPSTWDENFELSAWILRQKPPPVKTYVNTWCSDPLNHRTPYPAPKT
ncbi:hypothetical protein Turpa_2660 [Turneriella parva DSM 21527]|uniref:Uncharacterized protein n=1 Tax=Turneriella parva (strain ATCC BAA-1111 / DSM 21527 / NCTC 11395 / H) TaxID=869212 RepID=I4B7P3_TURPD|nr:hypothetical protein Turpa_2660 [Turneriella parva DSM 21527]